jgi:hypothetical protein
VRGFGVLGLGGGPVGWGDRGGWELQVEDGPGGFPSVGEVAAHQAGQLAGDAESDPEGGGLGEVLVGSLVSAGSRVLGAILGSHLCAGTEP